MNVIFTMILMGAFASVSHSQDEIPSEIQGAESAADSAAGIPSGPATLDQIEGDVPNEATPAPTESVDVSVPEEPSVSSTEETPIAATADENSEGVVDERSGQAKNRVKICNCKFTTDTAYKDRRTTWGGVFGFQAQMFDPTNYQPDFVSGSYDKVYGQKTSFEVVFGPKFNFFLGSLTAQIGAGMFQVSGTNTSLSVIPITAGGILALDTLFNEPYVVPYAGVGMYTDLYKEKAGTLSVQGSTAFSVYYEVGLMFQLDWIDPEAHRNAYGEYGMENTFLYVEGRSFLASSSAVADFSTPLQLAGGLKFEF